MIVVCLLENAGIHVNIWYLCVMLLWLARMMHGGFCKGGSNAFVERNIRMRVWIFRLNVPDLHGA